MRTLAAILTLIAVLQQNVLQVDVTLQQLVATVRDESGLLVKNLGPDDFILEENGVPQKIAFLNPDTDVPVTLGILIDTSGSMATRMGGPSRLEAALGTARILLHSMKPKDEFLLMSFSTLFSVDQRFTEDIATVESRLAKLKSTGSTNLIPAVISALKEIHGGKNRKRALIVITDAEAAGNLVLLRSAIQEAEVLIYTFAMSETESAVASRDILETLASESGGRSVVFNMQSDRVVDEMIAFVQDIAAELRGQYTVGYYPTGVDSVASRVIRLRTISPNYRVRTRRDALGVGR